MTRRIPLLLALALAAAGCQGEEASETRTTLGAAPAADAEGEFQSRLPTEVRLHVDSANAAYRAKQYDEALRHYREVTRLQPDDATGWFGIAMAAGALGNTALADSAQQKVQQLNPNLAGQAHPAPGTGAPAGMGGMPGGHPPIDGGATPAPPPANPHP